MLCTAFIGVSGILFQPTTERAGVIFTELATTYTYYNRWHLCYYFDLKLYYEQIDKLEICINQMNVICRYVPSNRICTVLGGMFEVDLRGIKLGQNALKRIHSRQKRAPFEFMGKFSHMLFGIMDADTARGYDEKINELQSEAELNRNLSKERLSLVKSSIQLNKKTFGTFEEKIDKLHDEINSLRERQNHSLDYIFAEDRFRDIVSIATLILMDHEKLSTQIEDILDDSIEGRLSALIPIEDLENDLAQIQKQLGRNQILPTELKHNGIHNIGRLISTRATLFGNRIFIEMGIPIVENNQYVLYKSVPVPVLFHNRLVVMAPASKYFLMSFLEAIYIPMTEEDLQACLHFDGETLICNPFSPLYHNVYKVCELAIFTNQSDEVTSKTCSFSFVPMANYIIQINHQDKYYVSIEKPIDVLNSCVDKRVEVTRILENGILTIEPECTIRTSDIYIRSHNHKYFNDTKIIFPSNSIHNLNLDTIVNRNFTAYSKQEAVLIQDYEGDFDRLAEQADVLIERENEKIKFEQIHYDNATHSYAIFGIMAMIVILSAVIGFIIYKKVNPLSSLLSLITGIPASSDTNGVGSNDRQIVINIDRNHGSGDVEATQ